MKINIEFDFDSENGNHEEARFKTMMQSESMSAALTEIWDRLFRPYWKHGYDCRELEELTNLDTITNEQLSRIIEILGDKYTEILRENNINLD